MDGGFKQEIRELGFLYQLDEWAILKALQNPYVTSHGQIRLDRLRSFVRSEYCMQFGSTPVVAKKADAEQAKEEKKMPTDPDKPLSEEEKHIRQLAQISPMQLLAFYQKGGRIPASDVEIVVVDSPLRIAAGGCQCALGICLVEI